MSKKLLFVGILALTVLGIGYLALSRSAPQETPESATVPVVESAAPQAPSDVEAQPTEPAAPAADPQPAEQAGPENGTATPQN